MKLREMIKEKNWLRAVLFLLAAALVFIYLNNVFNIGNTDASREIIRSFYEEEEDTIDMIYMGTSATNRYYNPTLAYEEYGIAGYNMAIMGMPMFFVPTMIDEVEKTQDPQLYVFELRNVLKSKNEVTDAHIRRVTDSLKVSSNKFKAIDIALDYTEGAEGELSNIDEGLLDYYVPIVKYHGRLTSGELTAKDVFMVDGQSAVKGYVLSPLTVTEKAQKASIYSDERADLAPEMEAALIDVLDECDKLKKEGKEVMFILAPYVVREGQMDMFNTAMDIVTERGYTVLNCNDEQILAEMDIDWEKDFYNSKHVNYIGAEKYTRYISEYLLENYDLPDRRGDENYQSWSDGYDKYCKYVDGGIRFVK